MRSLYDELNQAKLQCQFTNKAYIPSQVIQEKVTWEAVQKILPETTPRRWLPCWDYSLSETIQDARKVVAILLLIGRRSDTKSLLLGDSGPKLTDKDLPLEREDENIRSCCGQKIFATFATWEPGTIDSFLSTQWIFLEPVFELDPNKTVTIKLPEHCSLESRFTSCIKVTKTESSDVHVYKGIPRAEGRDSPVCVALKMFNGDKREAFAKEKKNLMTIQSKGVNNRHLVKHLAICEPIPCIVFPWAEGGDLGDFWQAPSSIACDTLWSLEQMVGLAHALEDLHCVNIRHGDLKPANILCFIQGGTKILKITDFGISRAHITATNFRNSKTITSASTRAYEGPELIVKHPILSRRYDCWSMGCILLEFVIWLLHNYSAIESFMRARDSSKDHGYYRRLPVSSRSCSKLTDLAHVHEGVVEAMNDLVQDPRCVGTAFQDIINVVRDGLLKIEYKDRLEAFTLRQKLGKILETARSQSSYLSNGADPPTDIPEIFRLPAMLTSPKSTFNSTYQSTNTLQTQFY